MVLLAQYAGRHAVAGWSAGVEWREKPVGRRRPGLDGIVHVSGGGGNGPPGVWRAGGARAVGASQGGFLGGAGRLGFGVGWGAFVLLGGRAPAAVFFVVPLLGVIKAALTRFERGRA